MNPRITNISEINNILNFTLSNVDVSIANAIRRTLLSDIPLNMVFKRYHIMIARSILILILLILIMNLLNND